MAVSRRDISDGALGGLAHGILPTHCDCVRVVASSPAALRATGARFREGETCVSSKSQPGHRQTPGQTVVKQTTGNEPIHVRLAD